MTDHPITPPPELMEQWYQDGPEDDERGLVEYVATQAARWGADQELEACCHLLWLQGFDVVDDLRATRRPKPPSLKEQALADLDRIQTHDCDGDQIADLSNIRRALEQLDD